MKSPTKLLSFPILGACFLPAAASAAPMVAIGDNAALFLTGVAEIRYEDNVFRDRMNRVDDFRFRFEPGVELQFGSGLAQASLFASAEVVRWADESGLNDEFFHLLFNASLDESVYRINFHARYDERATNDMDANLEARLLEREETALGVNGRYMFTNLTSMGLGFNYDRREYKQDNASGHESWSIPVSGYYQISPGLDAQVGYVYRRVDILNPFLRGIQQDYRDNSVYVGAVGQMGSPMWVGDVKVGWTERKFLARDLGIFGIVPSRKMDSLTYDVGLTYNAVNSSHTLRVERDYLNSVVGGRNFSRAQISLGSRFQLVPMWSANTMIGYNRSDYSGIDRRDDSYFLRAGLVYNPNEYVRISASFTHQRVDDNDRMDGGSDYRVNILSVSASLRY